MIQHPSFLVEPWSLHETSLCLDVLAQTESLTVVVQAELVANEELPTFTGDPRVASASIESPLVPEENDGRDTMALLIHKTRLSGLPRLHLATETWPDSARVVATDARSWARRQMRERPRTARPRPTGGRGLDARPLSITSPARLVERRWFNFERKRSAATPRDWRARA